MPTAVQLTGLGNEITPGMLYLLLGRQEGFLGVTVKEDKGGAEAVAQFGSLESARKAVAEYDGSPFQPLYPTGPVHTLSAGVVEEAEPTVVIDPRWRTVDLPSSRRLTMGQEAGATSDGGVAVGARVTVNVDKPSCGWGSVKKGDVGVVASISGPKAKVDFPAQSGWSGKIEEFDVVNGDGRISGSAAYVPPNGWHQLDAGSVREIGGLVLGGGGGQLFSEVKVEAKQEKGDFAVVVERLAVQLKKASSHQAVPFTAGPIKARFLRVTPLGEKGHTQLRAALLADPTDGSITEALRGWNPPEGELKVMQNFLTRHCGKFTEFVDERDPHMQQLYRQYRKLVSQQVVDLLQEHGVGFVELLATLPPPGTGQVDADPLRHLRAAGGESIFIELMQLTAESRARAKRDRDLRIPPLTPGAPDVDGMEKGGLPVVGVWEQWARQHAGQQAVDEPVGLTQGKYPCWAIESFHAELLGTFAATASPESGEGLRVLSRLLNEVLSEQHAWLGAGPQEYAALNRCAGHLLSSLTIFQRHEKYLQWPYPAQAEHFVHEVGETMRELIPGDSLLVPIGQSGQIAVVEVETPTTARFTVINTSPQAAYHPKAADAGPGRLRQRTCCTIRDVSLDILVDKAFWLFTAQAKTTSKLDERLLYTHYMTYLCEGETFASAIHKTCGEEQEWRTPCVGTWTIWKGLRHALGYMLRRAGVRPSVRKLLKFNIRHQLLKWVVNDLHVMLSRSKTLPTAQRVMLRMAAECVARSASKAPGVSSSHPHLSAVLHTLQRLGEVLERMGGIAQAVHLPPKCDFSTGEEKQQQSGLHGGFEHLRRPDPVDHLAGERIPEPSHLPVNFLSIPDVANTFTDALRAMRATYRMCTRAALQSAVVRGSQFLIAAQIQHLFLWVLPPPRHGDTGCIWSGAMVYGQQLDVLLLLQCLCEHWASAVFSIRAAREHDAVRITVAGMMAAIADCVTRQLASDDPSILSRHLRGHGGHSPYAPTAGPYAVQSETIVTTAPEVCVARTAILDYFSAVNAKVPEDQQVFAWEDGLERGHHRATLRLLRQIAAAEAFPMDAVHMYVLGKREPGHHYLIQKMGREWNAYRDVVFYFKYFMQTNTAAFPPTALYTQFQAQLTWGFNPQNDAFTVSSLGVELTTAARRDKHRWPSYSVATRFTFPEEAYSEDDLLHIKSLPSFGDLIGQRDSELLLSYLTAPYLRIPLVLHFFASEDRAALLRAPVMQKLLDSVLFEPGRFQSAAFTHKCPQMVPVEKDELLATPYGLLFNELQHSPDSVVEPLIALLGQAVELDSGTVFNETAVDVLLYLVRTIARVFSYLWLLTAHQKRVVAAGWKDHPLRGVSPLRADVVARLESFQESFSKVLAGDLHPMIERWIREAINKVTVVTDGGAVAIRSSGDLDSVTTLVSQLHAHLLLLYRCSEMSQHVASSLLSSSVFLTLRHTWNNDKLVVPETEVYDVLQQSRRRLASFLCAASPVVLSPVLDGVVRVATSTGSRLPRPEDRSHEWAFVEGAVSLGRFSYAAPRYTLETPAELATEAARCGLLLGLCPDTSVIAEGGKSVEISIQTFLFTYKHGHLKALPADIAGNRDVVTVFCSASDQKESFQCATVENAEHREVLLLVGRDHEIHWWKDEDDRVIQRQFDREFPDDMEEEERWIVDLLKPVHDEYLWVPVGWTRRPYLIFLCDDVIGPDETVAWLEGVHPLSGVKLCDIYVHRHLRSVQVFDVFAYGRRLYRSLVYASDARSSLRFLQPSIMDRSSEWAPWARHEAGGATDKVGAKADAVIIRQAQCGSNLSGTDEQFIPARLLHGLLPSCLLESHLFWQDKRDRIRGYPIQSGQTPQTHLLFVELLDRPFQAQRSGWTLARVVRLPYAVEPVVWVEPQSRRVIRLAMAPGALAPSIDGSARPLTREVSLRAGGQQLFFPEWEKSVGLPLGDRDLIQQLRRLCLKAEVIHDIDPEGTEGTEIAVDADAEIDDSHALVRTTTSWGGEMLGGELDDALPREGSAGSAGPGGEGSGGSKRGGAAVEDQRLLLIDLLHARAGTPLFNLARVIMRIEDLSHVLVWTRKTNLPASGGFEITWVHLPRLKLSFRGQMTPSGETVLASMDHAHLFLSNLCPSPELMRGLPHSLVLQDANSELTLLVPGFRVIRPRIRSNPFSTELVLHKRDQGWLESSPSRYFLYPVHVSLSFVLAPTLASALYLLLMRLLARDMNAAFRLADSIGTDGEYSPQEMQVFRSIGEVEDFSPSIHAVRVKVSLVTLDSPNTHSWYIPKEAFHYLRKRNKIPATCRLSHPEEGLLMELAKTTRKKLRTLIACAKEDEKGWEALQERAGNRITSALEGTLNQRRVFRAFLAFVQRSLRESVGIRAPWSRIVVLVKMLKQHVHSDIPFCEADYVRCLLRNHVAYMKAAAAGESFSKVVLPPPGIDDGINFWSGSQLETLGEQVPPLKIKHSYQKTTKAWEILDSVAMLSRAWVSGGGAGKASMMEGSVNFLFLYELLVGETTVTVRKDPVDGRCLFWMFVPLLRQKVDIRREPGLRYLLAAAHAIKANPTLQLPEWAPPRREKEVRRCVTWDSGVAAFDEFQNTLRTFLTERSARARDAARLGADVSGESWVGDIAPPKKVPPCPPCTAGDTMPVLTLLSTRSRHEALLQTACLPRLSDVGCSTRIVDSRDTATLCGGLQLKAGTPQMLTAFAGMPLSTTPGFEKTVANETREQQGLAAVAAQLPFEISQHPAAHNIVAEKMMHRLAADAKDFARHVNTKRDPVVQGLDSNAISSGGYAAFSRSADSIACFLGAVDAVRMNDESSLAQALSALLAAVNEVPEDSAQGLAYKLRRYAGAEVELWLEYVLGSLLSSSMDEDITKLNPFLSTEALQKVANTAIISILLASRLGQGNKARTELGHLLRLLGRQATSPEQGRLSELRQQVGQTAKTLTMERAYLCEDLKRGRGGDAQSGAQRYFLDPRFLLFEFTWNIVLRKEQIEMVNTFMSKLHRGESHVRQMIMGAGKTTVVGPLISLMAADGKRLVMQVMPPALLDFTRETLRKTFASTMAKQIYSFACDRQIEVDAQAIKKFQRAASTRSIVVTTPSSLKSVALKFVESLDRIEDRTRPPPPPELEEEARELQKILTLWRSNSLLVMDEVDLLLHPLKSELNFPIGRKHDLPLAPLRWRLPVHLLDLVFGVEIGRSAVASRESGKAAGILADMRAAVQLGYQRGALQAMPHLILLDSEFYIEQIIPVMARWLYLWFEGNHFTTLGEAQTIDFVSDSRRRKELAETAEAQLSKDEIQILNLGHDWLHAYLPHILQKIDRVTFGIMTPEDIARALQASPQMPRSRFKLAIPFVGKDLPSESSEFAHPDIVIGLSVMAYRYEGLREADFDEVLAMVQQRVQREVGNWRQRRTNRMYERWVDSANGRLVYKIDYKRGSGLTSGYRFISRGTNEEEVEIANAAIARGAGGESGEMVEDDTDNVTTVRSAQELDQLIDGAGDRPVVVDWYARWCPPCRVIAPYFAQLSSKFVNTIFIKADVDVVPQAAADAAVSAMPTFMVYKRGEKVGELCGGDERRLLALMREHNPSDAAGGDRVGEVDMRPAMVSAATDLLAQQQHLVPLSDHDPAKLWPAVGAALAATLGALCDGLFADVLPLRKLQQSNRLEVNRLYQLLRMCPETIHWYLDECVFPEYMRHQTVKLSASGHELGSATIFPVRMGFSGTPSDLLPVDLGECDYERTTDGRLVHTLTNPEVVCYSLLPKGWSAQSVLEDIARQWPPFHALIDTGALITGFSNYQVAKFLLEPGRLPSMEGVVFLDEDDRKVILVRATGRVLRLEECGIPVDRRFTFFDQVHTTGMDVKQAPNAQAAITLGKDMVFRDFAQGAYRMRGIGAGQSVQVLIIPEVYELIERELSLACASVVRFGAGDGPDPRPAALLQGTGGGGAPLWIDRRVDPVALVPDGTPVEVMRALGGKWLFVTWGDKEGYMRSGDVARKPAQELPKDPPPVSSPEDPATRKVLVGCVAWLMVNSMRMERLQYNQLCIQKIQNVYRKGAFGELIQSHDTFTVSAGLRPSDRAARALAIYREPIEFAIQDHVPRDRLFEDVLREMVNEADPSGTFVALTPEGSELVAAILAQVRAEKQRHQINYNTEMVQEQEEEKEQEQEKEEEKEVEVEKFIDLVYSRDSEQPEPWEVRRLSAEWLAKEQPSAEVPAAMYDLQDFRLYRRRPLAFPDTLKCTRNFFDLRWSGERRIKNVIVALEWMPSAGKVQRKDATSRDFAECDDEGAVAEIASLLGNAAGCLDQASLPDFARIALGLHLDRAAIARQGGLAGVLDASALGRVLRGNVLREEQSGRFFVLVALCEAEAIRRVMHVRGHAGRPLIDGADTELGMRVVTAGGTLLDRTPGFTASPADGYGYQERKAQVCFRFFDGELQYSDDDRSLLLRSLSAAPAMQRMFFFGQVRGCRRRGNADKWEATPLGQVFRLSTGYSLARQLALGAFLQRAVVQRGYSLSDAFRAFNQSEKGELLPSEVWGGLQWLGLQRTAGQVLEFLESADSEGRGTLTYPDYLSVLTGRREEDEDQDDGVGKALPTVPPYGEMELRAAGERLRRQRVEETERAGRLEQERDEVTQSELFRREDAALLAKGLTPNPHFDEASGALYFDFTHPALPRQALAYGRACLQRERQVKEEEAAAGAESLEGRWEYVAGGRRSHFAVTQTHTGSGLRWSERLASGREVYGDLCPPSRALPPPTELPGAELVASLSNGGALWLHRTGLSTVDVVYKADPNSTRHAAPVAAQRQVEIWAAAGWSVGTESFVKLPLLRLCSLGRHMGQVVDHYVEEREEREGCPQELYVSIPGQVGYDGRYVLVQGEAVRGHPVWAMGERRVYGSTGGRWIIGSSDGMERSKGMIQSAGRHTIESVTEWPHNIGAWKQCFRGDWEVDRSVVVADQLSFAAEKRDDSFAVGDPVQLAPDYKDYSDAASGPLQPGETGTISKTGDKRSRFLVSHTSGATYWYDTPALRPAEVHSGPGVRRQAALPGSGLLTCSLPFPAKTGRYVVSIELEDTPRSLPWLGCLGARVEGMPGVKKLFDPEQEQRGVYLRSPFRTKGELRTLAVDTDSNTIQWFEGRDATGVPAAEAEVCPHDWPLVCVIAGGLDREEKEEKAEQEQTVKEGREKDHDHVMLDVSDLSMPPSGRDRGRRDAFMLGAEESQEARARAKLARMEAKREAMEAKREARRMREAAKLSAKLAEPQPVQTPQPEAELLRFTIHRAQAADEALERGPSESQKTLVRPAFRHWSLTAEVRFPGPGRSEVCLVRGSAGLVLLLSAEGTIRIERDLPPRELARREAEEAGDGGKDSGAGAVNFHGFTDAGRAAAGRVQVGDDQGHGGGLLYADDPTDRLSNRNSSTAFFWVGQSLTVVDNYKDYGDASGGPLKPGELGIVTQIHEGSNVCVKSGTGRSWWYVPQALRTAGAEDIDPGAPDVKEAVMEIDSWDTAKEATRLRRLFAKRSTERRRLDKQMQKKKRGAGMDEDDDEDPEWVRKSCRGPAGSPVTTAQLMSRGDGRILVSVEKPPLSWKPQIWVGESVVAGGCSMECGKRPLQEWLLSCSDPDADAPVLFSVGTALGYGKVDLTNDEEDMDEEAEQRETEKMTGAVGSGDREMQLDDGLWHQVTVLVRERLQMATAKAGGAVVLPPGSVQQLVSAKERRGG
eukprot:Hpha_TRINITY_DN15008_c2_g11::TRINITY_DN15008_c2_g11_i2::g.123952::m.123952